MTPLSNPVCVFVDASVLFSAALSADGSARDLVLSGQSANLDLVISSFVELEVERNLRRKAVRGLPAFEQFVNSNILRFVNPPAQLVREIAAIVEPKDAPIVAGAVFANSGYIASYDRRHLLSQSELILQKYRVIVTTPNAISELFAP